MSDEEKNIKYKVSTEGLDEVGSQLSGAEGAASAFEQGLGRVSARIIEYAAIYGSIDFFKGAYEDFQKLNQAQLQLTNTLTNVGDRAGITRDELIDMAKAGREHSEFSKDQYIGAETALLRFKNLNKETFQETLSYAADIAQSKHESVDQVTGLLGTIVGNPAEAGRRLREFDVILSPYQQKWLRAQTESGHMAIAQQFIFEQLKDHGYEGAAALAAMNDPLHDVNASMEELKEQLGEGLTGALREITPLLMHIIEDFSKLVKFITDNETELKELAVAVTVAYTAFKVWELAIVPLAEGLAALPAVEAEAATGMEAVGAAADAASGPIGLLALALGAVTLGFMHAANARDEYLNSASKDYEDITEQDFNKYKKQGQDEKTAYQSTIAEDTKDLDDREARANKERQTSIDEYNAKQKKLGDLTGDKDQYGPYDPNDLSGTKDENIDYWDKEIDKIGADRKGLGSFKDKFAYLAAMGKGDKGGDGSIQPGAQTQKAEGPKVTNINVHIDNLIHDFTVKTTTVQGSSSQIKQLVAEAVLDAVNDAEILAGQER